MAEVRIEDLRSPVLSAEQRAILDGLEARPVHLGADRLVEKARAGTGLTDLGDDSVLERLAAHVAAIEADTGLTNLGRLVLRMRILRLLENRLRLHELLRHHPEIHDIEISAPLVVVGLPRSGTTHLVNLLAQDPRRRAPGPRRGPGSVPGFPSRAAPGGAGPGRAG